MIPILGAYLVQTGDLTRTVYLASLPVVVSTALWVWVSELISLESDLKIGRNTMIMIFPPQFSGRYIPNILIILILVLLIASVIIRHSLNPLSLTGLLSIIFGIKTFKISWNSYSNISEMLKVQKYAFIIHLIICLSICLSSLIPSFNR